MAKNALPEDKKELLDAFENGMTVKDLIGKLERMDPDLVVVNACRDDMPVTSVEETGCDYCYDEIITKRIVSVF